MDRNAISQKVDQIVDQAIGYGFAGTRAQILNLVDDALAEKSLLLESAQQALAREAAGAGMLQAEIEKWKSAADSFAKRADDAELQVELWREYHAFVNKANEGAITLAYVHGWRCADEDVAKGVEYRKRLGIPDSHESYALKRKKLCGVWVREMGPCVAELHLCKAHPRCGAIPEGGGDPCHKASAHGGVCENDTHVWDWKPKLRTE